MARYGTVHRGGRPKGSGMTSLISRIVADKVEDMVTELFENKNIRQQALEERSKNPFFSGWIYLIKDKSNGLYKIGMTQQRKLDTRIGHYRAHDMDVELVYGAQYDFIEQLETDIHALIPKEVRVKGDWFVCDMAMLCKILKTLTSRQINGWKEEQ